MYGNKKIDRLNGSIQPKIPIIGKKVLNKKCGWGSLVRTKVWYGAEEGVRLAAIRCTWLWGNAIHYKFICFFKQHLELRTKYLQCSTESGQKTLILHSLGLWRYPVWSGQGGFEKGSLPDIQQANSKEADGIPAGLKNEGKPASVYWNSSRRLQKKEAKKPTLCRISNRVLA